MALELTDEESLILAGLIDARIAQLGPEIHHTRMRDYRAELERLRQTLEGLRAKIKTRTPAPVGAAAR